METVIDVAAKYFEAKGLNRTMQYGNKMKFWIDFIMEIV